MKKINQEAFEKLYKENYIHLVLVSLTIVKDRSVSEDIVHTFFETLWKKKETLTIHKNFKSYAISAVKKLSFKQLRTKERERQSLQTYSLPPLLPNENGTLVNDQVNKMHEIIQSIPESRRNIFLDYVLGGLSYKEIAEMRNISLNTVKAQMQRTYEFIRKLEMDKVSAIILLTFFLTYFF